MEPATLMAIVEVAIQAWKENEEKKNFSAWQQNVTTKLNQILDNTVEILNDLKRLRVDIDASLDSRFQNYFLAGLRASISDVGDVLSGVPDGQVLNAEQRSRISDIADKLRSLLKQSLAYGYAVLPISLCGYVALLPAMRISGYSAAELTSTRNSLNELVFGPALDQDRTGSFGWTLNTLDESIKQDEATLSEALRPATLAMWWQDGGVHELFQAYAAVVDFHGVNFDPTSITASEPRYVPVEEPAPLFGKHIDWTNVVPAPAIGIDWRTNSVNGARENRAMLLKKYVSIATNLIEMKANRHALAMFISRTKAILALPVS